MTFAPAVSPAVTSKWSKGSGGPAGDECQNLVSQPQPIPFDTTQITSPANRSRPEPGDPPAIAFALRGRKQGTVPETHADGANVGALRAASGGSSRDYVAFHYRQDPIHGVRRLTPTECERLQGFPDGWTDVTYRGKPAGDGPRYKALGNSMAVPVMRWIGQRIKLVDEQP